MKKVVSILLNIFFWFICVFMALLTLILIPYGIHTFFSLLCGLFACPLLIKLLNGKIDNKINLGIQFLIVFILLICSLVSYDTSPQEDNNDNSAETASTAIATQETEEPQETEEEKQARLEKEKLAKEQAEAYAKAQKEQEEKDFKESCQSYTYKEIARNPSNYIGKTVKFTGKVIQVSEGYFNSIAIRMDITKDEYGYYDDTIYCNYTYSSSESKILEDDIITIYGTFKGEKSYTSVLGAKITLPEVDIKYLTINE